MLSTLPFSQLIEINSKIGLLLFNCGIDFVQASPVETLEGYCEKNGLNTAEIESKIQLIIANQNQGEFKPSEYSMQQIVHYLSHTHHEYAKVKLPEIRELITHIQNEPSLSSDFKKELLAAFDAFELDLKQHIAYEEKDVFPYIEEMIRVAKNGQVSKELLDYFARMSMADIMDHHHDEMDEMPALKSVTQGLFLQSDAPLSYKAGILALKDLEADLQQHNGIEDLHLFPQAQMLESFLQKKIKQMALYN